MNPMDYAGVTLDYENEHLSDPILRAIHEGEYELEETTFVAQYLESDMDVVELGGGIGYLACYVDQRLADDRTHVVVEPNGRLLETIEQHRALNDGSFEVVNAAYAPEAALVTFRLAEDFWVSSTRSAAAEGDLYVGTVDVETLFAEFDLSNAALIADVEGSEVDLIREELHVLESRCSLLVVEFHGESRPEIADEVEDARRRLRNSAFELVDSEGNVAVYRTTVE